MVIINCTFLLTRVLVLLLLLFYFSLSSRYPSPYHACCCHINHWSVLMSSAIWYKAVMNSWNRIINPFSLRLSFPTIISWIDAKINLPNWKISFTRFWLRFHVIVIWTLNNGGWYTEHILNGAPRISVLFLWFFCVDCRRVSTSKECLELLLSAAHAFLTIQSHYVSDTDTCGMYAIQPFQITPT